MANPVRRLGPRAAAGALGLAAVLAAIFAGAIPGAEAPPRFEGGLIPAPRISLPVRPAEGVVFLFSDGAWGAAEDAALERFRRRGAAAIGVETPAYLDALAEAEGACVYLVADFERLGREAQRATGSAAFAAPILAGAGAGGALALDALAQTPFATIGGVVAVDPAEGLPHRRPLCTPEPRRDTPSGAAWMPPAGEARAPVSLRLTPSGAGRARAAAMRDAGADLTHETVAGPPLAALLDAVERSLDAAAAPEAGALVTVEAEGRPGDALAIVVSGDGGWRDIDRQLARHFQQAGVPVIGVDALRWFWRARTPEETGALLSRIVLRETAARGARRVALVGFSFGAGVIPEAWAAMTPEARAPVAQISLLAIAPAADWEITVSGWLGAASAAARPVGPALRALPLERVQCIHGAEEAESACPALEGSAAEVIRLAGGHHFDGDYAALAARILDGLERRGAPGG